MSVALALAGCASGPQIPPGTTCEVSGAQAPFYKYGPAQALGPDQVLSRGTTVTLLTRSMGFSRVMLGNGVTGYVSNDDISPAAPEAPPKPGSVVTHRTLDPLIGTPNAKPKRSSVAPTPGDPLFDVNDVPLPQKEEPKPAAGAEKKPN